MIVNGPVSLVLSAPFPVRLSDRKDEEIRTA